MTAIPFIESLLQTTSGVASPTDYPSLASLDLPMRPSNKTLLVSMTLHRLGGIAWRLRTTSSESAVSSLGLQNHTLLLDTWGSLLDSSL